MFIVVLREISVGEEKKFDYGEYCWGGDEVMIIHDMSNFEPHGNMSGGRFIVQ